MQNLLFCCTFNAHESKYMIKQRSFNSKSKNNEKFISRSIPKSYKNGKIKLEHIFHTTVEVSFLNTPFVFIAIKIVFKSRWRPYEWKIGCFVGHLMPTMANT